MAATRGPRALSLAATPNLKALDVDLTAKSCHESVIIK